MLYAKMLNVWYAKMLYTKMLYAKMLYVKMLWSYIKLYSSAIVSYSK